MNETNPGSPLNPNRDPRFFTYRAGLLLTVECLEEARGRLILILATVMPLRFNQSSLWFWYKTKTIERFTC